MSESESVRTSRYRWNLIMFTISFVISNLVSGIIYDVYVNYLQEVSRSVATSFWSYYGYSAFISAALLFIVPRIGYKILLLFCAVSSTAALFAVLYSNSTLLFSLCTLFALVGLQLHYAMLNPYVAAYTKQSTKIRWYTRAYYMGYAGYFLTTFFGGILTVRMFAHHAGITYRAANALTEFIEDMAPDMRAAYLAGNKDVLLMTGILAAVAIIPVLFIREKKQDYEMSEERSLHSIKDMIVNFPFKELLNRYAVCYLIYWVLINFGMGLISSYFTIFLNRNLHIDRATSSIIVSLSYLAIVIFMFFAPWFVKKFGQVNTLGGISLLSVPFMLIIANGEKFGRFMIPVVGMAFFMRSGLINMTYPADSSVSMELVPADLRPAFSTVVNVIAGLSSIAAGWFTGNILFVDQEGYRTAYYITAVCYAAACILILIGLRRFNRTLDEPEGEDPDINNLNEEENHE